MPALDRAGTRNPGIPLPNFVRLRQPRDSEHVKARRTRSRWRRRPDGDHGPTRPNADRGHRGDRLQDALSGVFVPTANPGPPAARGLRRRRVSGMWGDEAGVEGRLAGGCRRRRRRWGRLSPRRAPSAPVRAYRSDFLPRGRHGHPTVPLRMRVLPWLPRWRASVQPSRSSRLTTSALSTCVYVAHSTVLASIRSGAGGVVACVIIARWLRSSGRGLRRAGDCRSLEGAS